MTLEDYNGRLEMTVFPKQWALCSLGIAPGKIIGVRGTFKTYNERLGFTADSVFGDPLQMKPSRPTRVCVEIDQSQSGRSAIKEIRKVSTKHRGTAELVLVVYPNLGEDGNLEGRPRRVVADSRFNVDGSPELLNALKECQSVYDVYSE